MSHTPTLEQALPTARQPDQIRQMFDRIAPTYDRLNDTISLGLHRGWKKKACAALTLPKGGSVLDVCTGTGDLVTLLADCVGPAGFVTGVDFSPAMLTVAQQRFAAHPGNIAFQQADAMALPFADNTFDGAIVSFGLRNVAEIETALAEMVRVVKPGGRVVNLDTCPTPALPGFGFYFTHIMPRIGALISRDPTAYQYLSTSSKNFLSPDALARCFKSVGLQSVTSRTLGFGSVSLQVGVKSQSH